MPVPTPFHPRTSELCTSLLWKEWAGHYAVCSYGTCHEREYFALRHAAGLIDVSPLHKYEIAGPGAGAFLSFLTTRDLSKLRVGRMTYLCWCDDDGKVLDDGTAGRLDKQHYRLTSNQPALSWLERNAAGFDVAIEDSSERLGVVALQGPTSRAILAAAAGPAVESLRFFAVSRGTIDGIPVWISRTGYTGDLGYEVWVERDGALGVWDALVAAGRPYRIRPAGLNAMDVTRVEAGFVLNGVDYFSANTCLIPARRSSPYEIGLGWTVTLDREPFIGQAALRAECARPADWRLVGLEYDWDEFEALHDEFGLPPHVPSAAWRSAVPVYDGERRQVGQATSGAWSPILKKNLALATLRPAAASTGSHLRVETTVEYERRTVGATVVGTPFFDPPRKRA
ncbi:MAG TPA: aminomethyltransferase family protein [Candidatus Polarisedimenticolaceae bacterium]|nr:aminomethyltransferase family protein [Candidatus Polarisedimenticolaceae bacterium]